MPYLRYIAILGAFLLCLLGVSPNEEQPFALLQEATEHRSDIARVQTILHDYSDPAMARTLRNTTTSTTLSLRIPHKKGSTRHQSWLSMQPTATSSIHPYFHGGHICPKTVARSQAPYALSRLCRLII